MTPATNLDQLLLLEPLPITLRNDIMSLDVDMAFLRIMIEGTAKTVVSNSTGQVWCMQGVFNWKCLCG